MTTVSKLLSWFRVVPPHPEIAVAQFRELQRQIPLLYALLSVNALAVAYTYHGLAPDWLTVVTPALLVSICLIRLLKWMRQGTDPINARDAGSHLRRTAFLGPTIAIAYLVWSLSLNSYGGTYEEAHVAIFVAVTVIGCIFCLMHLPQAAIAVMIVVTVPYLVYYLHVGNPVFIAIALNILLVALVMVQVLRNSFKGFAELVLSRAETHRLSGENLKLAHTDVLTGLPNRRYFFSALAIRLEATAREGSTLAVGLFDLDRFKPVNDTFGHVIGDRLLETLGRRLSGMADKNVVVARLGGDEFGFFASVPENEAAAAIGQSFCDACIGEFQFDDITLAIGASCGVAVFPDTGRTPHQLFDQADYALYMSKSLRRGHSTLYSPDHEIRSRSDRSIETALLTANLDDEMSVHLQPIIDANDHTVIAAEALARWTSPLLGSVAPDRFIAVAERVGLIHKLTLALLGKALKQLELLPDGFSLSFNLSAHDVTSTHTILAILSLVHRSSIDPSRLIFELTETAMMRDFAVAEESVRLLRSMGARIALDDFGTGYSSLSYLHRLPVDQIKVDRSFVQECGHTSGRNLLASVVALCTSMNIKCIVEGVETSEQLAVLDDLGCRYYQGYLFAKPMASDDFANWIEDNRCFALKHEGFLKEADIPNLPSCSSSNVAATPLPEKIETSTRRRG